MALKKETKRAAINEIAQKIMRDAIKNLPGVDGDLLTTMSRQEADSVFSQVVKSIKLPKTAAKDIGLKELAQHQIAIGVNVIFAYNRLRQFGISDNTANQVIREVGGVA